MFRLRLEGENRLTETNDAAGVRIFFKFLDLAHDGSHSQHSAGWCFRTLRRVGSNQLADRRIAELSDFGVPEQFAALSPSRQTQLEEKLLGFRDFLLFCQEFEQFLSEVADYPLLQSAIWHYELFNVDDDRLRVLLSSVNRALSLWPGASDQAFLRARGSFLRLAEDDKYSGALIRAYSALSRESVKHTIRELEALKEKPEETRYMSGLEVMVLDDQIDELWADLRTDPVLIRDAEEAGIELRKLGSFRRSDVLQLRREGEAFDPVTTAIVVSFSPVAAKIVKDLWEHVLLPRIRQKYGTNALNPADKG
jgi:hypothetical protein